MPDPRCHASCRAGSVTCNGAEWDAPLLRWQVADLVDEAADGDLSAGAAHRTHSSVATLLANHVGKLLRTERYNAQQAWQGQLHDQATQHPAQQAYLLPQAPLVLNQCWLRVEH